MLLKSKACVTILMAFLLLCSQPLLSKSHKVVKFTSKYEKLGEVLQTIQQQSGIRLVYANSVVDSFEVFRKFEDSPYEAVRKSLIGTPLDFVEKSPNLWVIVPRSETEHLPATITGTVIDINLEQPIPGANVYIFDSENGTTTDQNGYFELHNISPGMVDIVVHRIGYHELEMEMRIRGNTRKNISIALEAEPITTPEVVLEAETYPKQNSVILTEQKMTRNQIDTPPIANDGEVFELLHQQPGVSRRDMDDIYPHVEGGSATEVMVELDGMPVYVPTFGENRRSVFAADIIENMTLHRSGFGVEHGDAMSGVVSLQTKDIQSMPFTTNASASLSGLSFGFRKNTDKLSVAGVWRNGKFNNGLAFDHFQGLDLFNKAEYRLSPNQKFTFLSLVSHGAFVQSNSRATEQLFSQNLGFKYEFANKKNKISALAYMSKLHTQQEEFGVRLNAKSSFSTNLKAIVGMDFYRLDSQGTVSLDSLYHYKVARDLAVPEDLSGNFYLPIETDPSNLFTQKATLLSPYISLNYTTKYWQVTGGARLPTELGNGNTYLEPRFRISLTPFHFLNLSTSMGRYHQFSDRSYASEAKSGDDHGRGEFVVKTSHDSPSRADHFRLESAFNFRHDFLFSVAYFDKKYHFRDRAYLSRINRWFWSLPLKEGQSRGYEYWIGKTKGRLQGWMSYTLNNEVYQSDGGTFFTPYFNRKNILNAAMSYFVTPSLQFKGQYLKSSGYPERDWSPERIVIDPQNTPEFFAQRFLTQSTTFGSLSQYAFGLKWHFAGIAKENYLNLVAVQTLEEGALGYYNGLKFWASLIFAN